MPPCDRADDDPLRIVWEVPNGDCNREIEIQATTTGILIDDYVTIPWGWLQEARDILSKAPDRPGASIRGEFQNSEP